MNRFFVFTILLCAVMICARFAWAEAEGDQEYKPWERRRQGRGLEEEVEKRYPPRRPQDPRKGRSRRPSMIDISADNIEVLLRRNQVVVLAFVSQKSDPDIVNGLVTMVQQMTSDNGVVIGKTFDSTLRKRFNVKEVPKLLIVYNGGDGIVEYDMKNFDPEQVMNYISRNTPQYDLPHVGYMTGAHRTGRQEKPLLYVMLNFTEDFRGKWQNYFLRRFDLLADKIGRTMNFAVGNVDDHPDMSQRFMDLITKNISLPLLVLRVNGTLYRFSGEYSMDAIEEWLERWREGKLKPYRRTGSLVDNVPGTLYTLTTENFERVVSDWSKDVLVLFYGPRCPYSKEFLDHEMPKLLAMVDHVTTLVIAKIDCSVNDCPRGIVTGYPTISLYKGCKKTETKGLNPVSYWDVREADDLYRWLKSNSYYSIPTKKAKQPDGYPAEDPAIASAEQVGGTLEPLTDMSQLVI